MHAARASYDARLPDLDSGEYRGLSDCVVCDVMVLDDGLRDLGVRVTALVQRAACECSDACRFCQLPANALSAASIYSGGAALYIFWCCSYLVYT